MKAYISSKQSLWALMAVMAVAGVAGSWIVGGRSVIVSSPMAPQLSLSLLLIGLVVLAYQFPVHLPDHKKMWISSPALLAMAVLLPPALAVTGIGLAILSGELVTRPKRGTYLSDIAAQTGRWIVVGLTASLIAHMPIGYHEVPLLLAAASMWLGDIVTLPVVIAPISDENPAKIVVGFLKDGALLEAAQYLGGLVILLALSGSVALVALAPLTAAVGYLACSSLTAVTLLSYVRSLPVLRPNIVK